MTTAVYYRVSTEDQTLDMQRSAVEDWLEFHKELLPVREYSDHGISGKTKKRPGFQKLIRDTERGIVKTVIVYKLDRLTRDALTAIQVVLRFDEQAVRFISITQPMFSHGTPFRHAMIAIFAELAEMERLTIIERVKAGLNAARKRGVKFGPPVKTTPERVMEARKLRDGGATYFDIAKAMQLSVGSVHKMIRGKLKA